MTKQRIKVTLYTIMETIGYILSFGFCSGVIWYFNQVCKHYYLYNSVSYWIMMTPVILIDGFLLNNLIGIVHGIFADNLMNKRHNSYI